MTEARRWLIVYFLSQEQKHGRGPTWETGETFLAWIGRPPQGKEAATLACMQCAVLSLLNFDVAYRCVNNKKKQHDTQWLVPNLF